MRKLRILYCGLPLGALLLDHDGHDVVLAAVSRAEGKAAPGTRRLMRLFSRRFPHHQEAQERVLVQPDLGAMVSHVRELRPDLIVSWCWTKRIPKEILATAAEGAFNVHPSLLPRHRGPEPIFWALDSGDEVTGVTAHGLEEKYDTGSVYAQRTLPIDPSWNAWTLALRLDRLSLHVMRELTARFARGEKPKAEPQDESRATSAPTPTDDDLVIAWDDDTSRILRRIRAASPWPGMLTELAEHPILITRAEPTDQIPRALLPAEAAVVNGSVVVRTRDGGLRLLSARDAETDAELDSNDLATLITSAFAPV